jgi:hypothetical protein
MPRLRPSAGSSRGQRPQAEEASPPCHPETAHAATPRAGPKSLSTAGFAPTAPTNSIATTSSRSGLKATTQSTVAERVNAWVRLVSVIEHGYDDDIYEYANDLYCRNWIH